LSIELTSFLKSFKEIFSLLKRDFCKFDDGLEHKYVGTFTVEVGHARIVPLSRQLLHHFTMKFLLSTDKESFVYAVLT
jgi:hypothetical protein